MTEVIVWSGWIGGIAIGLYYLLQLTVTGRQLGASTAYSNICGLFSKLDFFKDSSKGNWRIWFLVGIPLGGFLGAWTSPGEIVWSFSLGEMYDSVLPQSIWAKGGVLLFGGMLIGAGSRMAGGCQSGHVINGVSLMNPPSFLAGAGFFLGGIIVVQLLFNVL